MLYTLFPQSLREVDTTKLILPMKKKSDLREVKYLVHGHMTREWFLRCQPNSEE